MLSPSTSTQALRGLGRHVGVGARKVNSVVSSLYLADRDVGTSRRTTLTSSRHPPHVSRLSVRAFHTAAPSLAIADDIARAVTGAAAANAPDVLEAIGGLANADRLKRVARDFRTDTITIPTDAQILYALRASRGDDVYREDPTTNALEERVARLSGKEAALFCSSTTMSNQLAIRSTLTQPPHSIICDHRAHTYMWEAGGAALFSQATSHALTPSNGLHLTADDIERNLCLGNDIHFAPNRMISLENTMSGVVFPQEEILKIHSLAKKHDLALHLDGARAWNVAARELERRGLDASKDTDIQAVLSELLEPFDTVGLCLSKGLGAPIGSILVGTKSLIDRARWFRKMFGGGWRQSGLLAAQADWAITHHMPRLAGTHKLAARLAEGLEDAGCEILAPVHTNMVYFDPSPLGLSTDTVMAALAALPDPIVLQDNRCVIHHQTSPKAVEDLVAEVHRLGHEAPQSERGKAKQAKLGY